MSPSKSRPRSKSRSRSKSNANLPCLSLDDWEKLANQKAALQLKDIKKLKPGDQLRLVTFDRNILDIIDGAEREGKVIPSHCYSPKRYFHLINKVETYIHSHDLQGTMLWSWGEKGPFEFDALMESKATWYPFENGVMRYDKDKDVHYSQYPNTLRLGWRGQSFIYDKILDLPRIQSPVEELDEEDEDDEDDGDGPIYIHEGKYAGKWVQFSRGSSLKRR